MINCFALILRSILACWKPYTNCYTQSDTITRRYIATDHTNRIHDQTLAPIPKQCTIKPGKKIFVTTKEVFSDHYHSWTFCTSSAP